MATSALAEATDAESFEADRASVQPTHRRDVAEAKARASVGQQSSTTM